MLAVIVKVLMSVTSFVDTPLGIVAQPMLDVSALRPTEPFFTQGQVCRVECVVTALLCDLLPVDSVTVYLSQNAVVQSPERHTADRKRASITSSVVSGPSFTKLTGAEHALKLVAMREGMTYGFFCRQAYQRSMSAGTASLNEQTAASSSVPQGSMLTMTGAVTLADGENRLILEGQVCTLV